MSAHMLGHSNGFSVLLASAVRIAQGLGLHQLDDDDDDDDDYDDDDNDSDDISKDNLVKVEIGRRVWCQLCIQDWFSIPFTESYLIHRPCFTAAKPHNYDDDMNPVSEDFPTVTSYSRLFYDIAALMPELQNDVASCNTLYTRYEEVLKYDRQLRTLATKHLPYYLQNVPIEVTWPCYVPWARRSLAISSAHKVIMIHRKFLSLSFVNPMFEFTRKTCVAASRTIIKEQKEATRDGGPILWIHQAFSVTASVSNGSLLFHYEMIGSKDEKIILCLDMFHQSVSDRQSSEHRQLIQDGIDILSRCQTDMIAQRGVALLRAMLDAEQKVSRDKQCPSELKPPQRIQENMPRGNGIDIATIIQTFYRHDRANVTRSSRLALQVPSTIRAAENGNWTEMTTDLPSLASSVDFITPLGVDYAEGLDDILSLATNYLS
ncbi:hypothetical protein N7462_006720 [Penicillium macrosclerotiorum]|uniref:uncharacterized protein n=1 Tax=Penicillium macrosclerotiorum TaxID=303699 RepID=UPI002549B61E|nr:uncharacterized protein N7462_006720 [Penicillium macrosclerotiorum]KAJ5683555.1 hypothetical protein N7462_006720 [Penicillium macrosclerotiorum]